MKPRIICIIGPTASGKTPLAVELVQHLPCDIISVDSAMVFRGMDIGTAKPSADVLKRAPHRLIDIIDPSEHYSAGHFYRDAMHEIKQIVAAGRIPLLVGGSMMYFRALQKGIAVMPERDAALRAALAEQAAEKGWEAMHQSLAVLDPVAAARIHPGDSQRIQRALEVYMLTGQTITAIQQQTVSPFAEYEVLNIGLHVDRPILHARIEQRFKDMLCQGFIHEMHRLYQRGDLNPDLSSMRSVGYRQGWEYCAGTLSYDDMVQKAIAATRQLAKRQMTWLRSWQDLQWVETGKTDVLAEVLKRTRIS